MDFFRFDDPYENKLIETRLSDLAVALSQDERTQVRFQLHSTYNPHTRIIAISSFWESMAEAERIDVQKADVYLRAIGNRLYTDWQAIERAYGVAATSQYPQLLVQLVAIFEDKRLAAEIIKHRKGTTPALALRARSYGQLLTNNRLMHVRANRWANVVYADAYALTNHLSADVDFKYPEPLSAAMHCLRALPRRLAVAMTTSDTVALAVELVKTLALADVASDTDYRLFSFDIAHPSLNAHSSPSWVNDRASEEMAEPTDDGDSLDDEQPEKVEVWNEPQSSQATGALKMEINSPDTVPSSGDAGRMDTLRSPSSVTTRRGHAQQGREKDLGDSDESVDTSISAGETTIQSADPVEIVQVERMMPSAESRRKEAIWRRETETSSRKMLKLFDQMLLHKMQAAARNTRHGRLDKKLTRIVTDPHPRLFYHKSATDKPFDVAVQLLVDCSGSMYERLEALKPCLYLFHVTLRKAQIRHDICGYWEDTLNTAIGKTNSAATHLLHAIPWSDCLSPGVGAYIDQFEPQLDNRDGMAMREVGKQLLERPENQKWMIVLSDGEPAAEDYRNAVQDTKNAVRWLTQRGIYVLHVCLTTKMSPKQLEVIRQIYGKGSIVTAGMEQLVPAMEKILRMISAC